MKSIVVMESAKNIDVYLLPAMLEPDKLSSDVVVIIDILRATTTIIHGLAGGAVQVVPCLEVEEARLRASEIGAAAILGGERGGLSIPGFDIGNSPAEYSRDRVAGRTIVFTTTNGTRAMLQCKAARRILIGAFVNFSALCRELAGETNISLVCAGTDGEVTREDTLLAGAVVDDLVRGVGRVGRYREADAGHRRAAVVGSPRLNDQAEIAADAWRAAVRDLTDRPLGMMLRASQGGRNLIEIGHESDIDLAAQIDKFDIVPQLDVATWRIRVP